MSFPLFAGGRLIAAYRAAGFAADAERWQAVQTRQRVEFAVIQSYYTAVLAEQRVAVVDRALAAARAHLKRSRGPVRAGMVVNSDVLRTNVLVGGLEQQRIQAESQLRIAWASLAHTLGDEDQRFAPLAQPTGLTAARRAAPVRWRRLVARAVADRPEIKIAGARVKSGAAGGHDRARRLSAHGRNSRRL